MEQQIMATVLVTDWFVEEMIDLFQILTLSSMPSGRLYGCSVIRIDKKSICCKSMVYVTFVDTEGLTCQQ